MKLLILYGENNTGKSSWLEKQKNVTLALPSIKDFKNGKSFFDFTKRFIENNKNKKCIAIENFDCFMSYDFSEEIFDYLFTNYKKYGFELIIETRHQYCVNIIGRFIQEHLIKSDSVRVIQFEKDWTPALRKYDEDGFLEDIKYGQISLS